MTNCLIVTTNFPPIIGGSAIVYANIAKYADSRILVLTGACDPETGLPLEDAAAFDAAQDYTIIRQKQLRSKSLGPSGGTGRRVRNMVSEFGLRLRTLYNIAKAALFQDVRTICIGELISLGWISTALRYVPGMRCMIYVHGEEITTTFDYRNFAQNRQQHLKQCDQVVCVSSFTKRILTDTYNILENKVAIVSNGVDLDLFQPLSETERQRLRQEKFPDRTFIFLTISRLMEKKGVDHFLKALVQLRGQMGSFVYVVVGEGSYSDTLKHLTSELGLEDVVTFPGRVSMEELPTYYGLADLFVMPNRAMPSGDTEGFGLVFLEANACGTPVIAGQDGGVPDAVVDGETGLIVDGHDIDAIAGAALSLWQDNEKRHQMRQHSLNWARSSGWEARSEAFLGVLDTLEHEHSSASQA